MNGPDRLPYCATLLAALLATPATVAAVGDPNRALFATMMASRAADQGCLPAHLGLGEADYRQLVAEYFPGFADLNLDTPPETIAETLPEWSDLQQLLLDHRAQQRPSAAWMADIVATACAGRDHLWQDLGLLNREQLSQLMRENFPELARSNTGDMKWKKFLYHQFCAREGLTVCRAPSCGECQDYAKCFGPEH